ncbi:MAG: DNA polymerase IV [Bradymonadia bacterium]
MQHRTWERVIVHADMDAFYASVEELDNPALRNKPLAVGGSTQRGVVATSNYHARQFGVRSATPMATALRRCPQLTIVRPRMERYKEISRIVMEVFKTFTGLVEPLSLDEAFLDMTTAVSAFPTPEHMGHAIQRAVFDATGGLTVSVGVATTKLVAKIASDFQKPNGLTVVFPEQVVDFLRPLPVSHLWGVGPKAVKRLHMLELKTIGDIANASDAVLGQLGPTGQSYRRLARGIDLRPVRQRRRSKSVGWERTLEEDLPLGDALRRECRIATDGMTERLKKRGLRTLGIRLKLKTSDFQIFTRQAMLNQPEQDAQLLFDVVLRLLDQVPSTGPFRLVGVTAFSLLSESDGQQLALL